VSLAIQHRHGFKARELFEESARRHFAIIGASSKPAPTRILSKTSDGSAAVWLRLKIVRCEEA